jgi:hypothetical protein
MLPLLLLLLLLSHLEPQLHPVAIPNRVPAQIGLSPIGLALGLKLAGLNVAGAKLGCRRGVAGGGGWMGVKCLVVAGASSRALSMARHRGVFKGADVVEPFINSGLGFHLKFRVLRV